MDFHFQRTYRGPLRAVVFDWAGTVLDHGSMAPTSVVVAAFRASGIAVSVEQARGPMGMAKKDHLREVLRLPEVSDQWRSAQGRDWAEDDVEAIYQAFVPMQMNVLRDHADLVPGALFAVAESRRMGLGIGSTTGYTRPMMDVLMDEAARRGYVPDSCVTVDEVPAGRPEPWLLLASAAQMRAWPISGTVKVGDTKADVEEGLNAGSWTVAVAKTGNEMGLPLDELEALDHLDRERRLAKARERLAMAGAHYVIDGVADLPPVLEAIQKRLASGERP